MKIHISWWSFLVTNFFLITAFQQYQKSNVTNKMKTWIKPPFNLNHLFCVEKTKSLESLTLHT